MRPMVYAHRGGAALAPENTLRGLRRRAGAGADGIELDVRLSRDGVAVVIHDPTLDRTTDATGPVDGRTAAELAGSTRAAASSAMARSRSGARASACRRSGTCSTATAAPRSSSS